jgi:hypothetical protein
MTVNKVDRALNCVEVKREAQERIYAHIRKMTRDEQIAYFRKRAEVGRLGRWWRKIGHASAARSAKRRAHGVRRPPR